MSMHKAKGLQFPVVIIPVFPEKKMLTRKFLWIDLPKNDFNGLPTAMLESSGPIQKTEFSGKADEERDKTLLDAINLLYVAMTRAEEKLFVFSPAPPAKVGKPEAIPAFFMHYLQQSGSWIDGKVVYEFGTSGPNQAKKDDKKVLKRSLESLLSIDWREKVLIRASAPDSWDIDNPAQNFLWGNLVHTVFSRILNAGDEEIILIKMVDEGLIDQNQMNQLMVKVRQVLSNQLIRPFFMPENNIKTEAVILREDGNVYRPDRVIIREDEVTVLDFKTGKPKKEQEKQISLYGKLLNEMGFKEVKKYLVFVEPDVNIVEVR